jgi:hypothetical protein
VDGTGNRSGTEVEQDLAKSRTGPRFILSTAHCLKAAGCRSHFRLAFWTSLLLSLKSIQFPFVSIYSGSPDFAPCQFLRHGWIGGRPCHPLRSCWQQWASILPFHNKSSQAKQNSGSPTCKIWARWRIIGQLPQTLCHHGRRPEPELTEPGASARTYSLGQPTNSHDGAA